MELGTQSRSKLIAATGLGVLAVLLIARIFLGSGTPLPASPPPLANAGSSAPRAAPRTRGKGPRAFNVPHSIDPSLRYDWLKASEDTEYAGKGRNIFAAQAEIPEPVKKGNTDNPEVQKGPPLPPPPPPINLKFYGFASRPGEPKRVFLSEGEDVFIASEGEIVDRRYKVLHISPMSVEIEDVLNNNRQSIPLTQG